MMMTVRDMALNAVGEIDWSRDDPQAIANSLALAQVYATLAVADELKWSRNLADNRSEGL